MPRDGAFAARERGDDVVGVDGARRTGELGGNPGPTCERSLPLLRMSAPAPSVIMNPSRRASKGRELPDDERAVMLVNAAMATGLSAPSDLARWPPRNGRSRMSRAAVADRVVAAAHAVTTHSESPATPSASRSGPHRRWTSSWARGRARPASRRRSWKTWTCCSSVLKPPTPVANTTPARAGGRPRGFPRPRGP